jgi:hypothetical protein
VDASVHDFYATPGRFTALDDATLGRADARAAVDIVQGLLVYDVVAKPFYGVDLSPEQADAIHERDSEALLALARVVDAHPLDQARPPEKRVGARCHSFSRMTVALLRAAGVPARARCGFGSYFRPGWYEDHWVAERWDAGTEQWQMVDAQLDGAWCRTIGFDGDPFAITPTQFVTAGHAWQAWRRGSLDAGRCGLSAIDEHGPHWIAGNLRLDLASLNKVEMLPWDVWGARWEPGEDPTDELLERFDEVAALTADPDARFAELRARYETDAALRMDGTVFNVALGREEHV